MVHRSSDTALVPRFCKGSRVCRLCAEQKRPTHLEKGNPVRQKRKALQQNQIPRVDRHLGLCATDGQHTQSDYVTAEAFLPMLLRSVARLSPDLMKSNSQR